jgi:hypothetical protein
MKKIVVTLFVACISFCATAQTGYTVAHLFLENPNPDPVEIEQILETLVKNTSTSTTTYRWVRTTLCTDPAYGNSVCIGDNCYEQTTDTKTFELAPNDSTKMSMHLWKNGTGNPVAIVEVELYPDNAPGNAVVVKFVYGICTSLTVEPGAFPDLKIFPNPTTQFLQMDNLGLATRLEVLDAKGSVVITHDLTQSQTVDVSGLASGQFIARFSDDKGEKRTTRVFAKQ